MSRVELGPIDHVGVLVPDLEQAKRLYLEELGFVLEREASMDDLGLEAAFLRPGGGGPMVELVQLTVEGKRVPVIANTALGLDHVAIGVADIEATIAALADAGVETTTGVLELGGRRTVFTRPETSGGVVYQFLQASA
jgi:methylmalonyl-CoA/ethylmalonyl-CoA epimerase